MKATKNKKKNNKNRRKRQQNAQTQRRIVAPQNHVPQARVTPVAPVIRTYLPPPTQAASNNLVCNLSLTFLLTAILCLWFAQNSINAYWQQTYHQPSPIQSWSDNPIWRSGAQLQTWLIRHLASGGTFAAQSLPIETPSGPSATIAASPPTPTQATASDPAPIITAGHPEIHLHDGDMVLFAGDSMMEGIAPHLQRRLQREYGIASLNISKQSTGLAYPKIFDWPATIEQHLAQYPRIKVVAVFLGPNDPWDFPNPQGGTGYLKFQSPEWESVYRSRIRRIADAVAAHNARLIWLEIPPMRSNKLHSQMIYLNRIMADELRGRAFWLTTRQATGGQEDGSFGENLQHDGQTIRVRSKDGIHFTLKGQQILADHLGTHFIYRPQ